jgi:rhomboid family GlyGly-CTERM serine protease
VTTHSHWRQLARSLNCDGWYGVGLLAGLAVLLGPLVGPDSLTEQLRYERLAVGAGEWWRLLGAHVVHLDARHALLNSAGLALLWALFARSYQPMQWLVAGSICLVVIDAGFWFVSRDLGWYVGASAWLHGVFACGCMRLAWQRDPVGYMAGLALVAKLAWEQTQGPLPISGGMPVVTVSHLYGAIGGALAGVLLRPRSEPLY